MTAPWEDYAATQQTDSGPWSDYQTPGQSSTPAYSAKDAVGDVARPLLEGGGAAAGGALAAPLGPIAAAGGGALGFAAGKAGADLLDRGLGRKPLLQDVPQAAKETAGDAYGGAQAEGAGQVAAGVAKPLLGAMGKVRNLAGEWATGIPSKDFQTVANNPMAMRPGSLATAGAKFDEAATNAGVSSELTPEAVNRLRHPGQYAFDTFNKLKTEGNITPQEALHARQSLDASYPVANKKNGSYIRLLDQMRDSFQKVIAGASPELQAASKDYAIAKSGSRFQALLPQNKSGTPSFVRGATMVGGLMSGHPEALFMSPAVAGTVTAGTGAAGSAVKSIFDNPVARRGVVGGATSLFQPKPKANAGIVNPPDAMPEQTQTPADNSNGQQGIKEMTGEVFNQGKTLTREIARKFLDLANGSKDLARELARRAGYSW